MEQLAAAAREAEAGADAAAGELRLLWLLWYQAQRGTIAAQRRIQCAP
jgi:hypothetical protein